MNHVLKTYEELTSLEVFNCEACEQKARSTCSVCSIEQKKIPLREEIQDFEFTIAAIQEAE